MTKKGVRLTPLMLAIERDHGDIVDLLLNRGVALDEACPETGVTPLYFAVRRSIHRCARLLLERGADVNEQYSERLQGGTPLRVAILNCDVHMVELLLDHGADFTGAGSDGATALHFARKIGAEHEWPHEQAAIIELLSGRPRARLAGPPPEPRDVVTPFA